MNKGSIIFYTCIILILILPNTFGRLIFDLAGSLLILSLIIPIIIAIIGFLTWSFIQSKAITCKTCGATFFSEVKECPLCGSQHIERKVKNSLNEKNDDIPASNATIDITVKDK